MNDRLILAAALLTLAACTSSSSDVPAAGVWGEATVIEELSIGVESGADEYMFGTITSVAVSADATIYVSDNQPTVRTYDSDGVFLRGIGRQGQGPGEYVSAPGLGVLPSGMLVMRDSRGTRVSFFSGGGEYLDSFAVVPGVARTLIIDQEGDIFVERFEGDGGLVKYSAEGEELDRVMFPPQDRAGAATFVLGFGEGGIFPFPTETRSAWSPLGYVVTGRNDVYDIELREPGGTVHLTRDLENPPVSRQEQAEWEAFRQTLVERARARNRDTEYEPIPAVKPFFRKIYVGQEGRIWVFRYVAAEKRDDIEPLPDRPERPLLTWREPWTYDVFNPDGTFLGSVVVPEGLRPFVFRGEQIWGSLTDDDGVERVVRLRVVPEVQ